MLKVFNKLPITSPTNLFVFSVPVPSVSAKSLNNLSNEYIPNPVLKVEPKRACSISVVYLCQLNEAS